MNTLQKYFKDVNKYPLLTKEQEEEAILKAKFGDLQARDLLVISNLRFVVSVAKKFIVPGVTIEDLIQEGNIGLLKSIDRFDPSKGVKFLSYAVWWIKQNIYHYLNENGRLIRLPLNRIRGNAKYIKEKDKLLVEYGYSSEPEDLEEYSELIQVNLDDKYDDSLSLLEAVEDTNSITPDFDIILESFKVEILDMLSMLEKREAEILKLYYGIGIDRPRTLDEIGEVFSLTRERIRQIKELTLNRVSLKPKFKDIIRLL